MMPGVTCPSCNRCTDTLIAPGILPSRLPVYRCGVCGIDFFKDAPPDGYWDRPVQKAIYEEPEVAAERRRFFNWLLDEVNSLGAHGTLLDVGAGRGEFALAAVKRGWAASVVEPSVPATEGLAGLGVREVHNLTLEEFMPGRFYDLVTMLDVIEHAANPAAAMRKAASCLKPGGVLAVLTPDGSSLVRSILVAVARRMPFLNWALKYQYYLPHLSYVGERAFRSMAESCGLQVIRTIRTVTPKMFLLAKLRHHYDGYPGNGVFRAVVRVAYPLARLLLKNKLLLFARKPL